ncbi:leucine-rich repeat protein soc-2 homolog [Gadus morhua]|uniref:Wu:fc23c09 n=1 Tax=Gadus morhua TaxID=8049 RepID=A0A8C5BQK3_GADMO|nr:leucine-rich repeat protein soc-2 homolog [Gadus morhua]
MHSSDRVQACILLLMGMVMIGYSYVTQPQTAVAEATSLAENRREERRRGNDGPTAYEERRGPEREEKERNLVDGVDLRERPGEHQHRGAVWEGEGEVDGAPPGDPRHVAPPSAPPIGDGDAGGKRSPPDPRAGPPWLRGSLTPSPSGVPLRPPPGSTSTTLPAPRDQGLAGALGGVRGRPTSGGGRGLAEDPRPPRLDSVAPADGPASTPGRNQHGGEDPPGEELTPASTSTKSPPPPTEPRSPAAPTPPSARSAESMAPPEGTTPSEQGTTRSTVRRTEAVRTEPPALLVRTHPAANATTLRKAKLDQMRKMKGNKKKSSTTESGRTTAAPTWTAEETTTPYFPYFKDAYCPLECACYDRVVQCSDQGVARVPYGIPYNARYVLLTNNLISSLRAGSFRGLLSLEALVLSRNRLADAAVQSAFRALPALRRLHLDGNFLERVPTDLPPALEELRLDDNRVGAVSAAAWLRCPGLLVLSLRNNSLGDGSEGFPSGALSPLGRLRTLSLDGNGLTGAPLGLPLSLRELYLRGNRIRLFPGGVFPGPSQLVILDLSGNRLTDEGLGRDSLRNAPRLESLNLGANALSRVPRHLPASLRTLNFEGNLIASVGRGAFRSLPHLEHLGLARNRIARVAPGAFGALAALHQLDLSHNALRRVPRRLPRGLHSVALAHNRIRTVPRDAFCWEGAAGGGAGGAAGGGGGGGGGQQPGAGAAGAQPD